VTPNSSRERTAKKLQGLAKRIERMPTPDKLRLAAEILEKTNDVDMALAVISQAVEHLMFVKVVGQ
jgi:hypothetical protein